MMPIMRIFEENNIEFQIARNLLFDIIPFFDGEGLDFSNSTYFPPKKETSLTTGYYKWHIYPNRYMTNEVRGFFQHLVVDKQLSASYIKDYLCTWDKTFSSFVTEKYPNMYSIVDYDYQKLYTEYVCWLSKNGYQTTFNRQLAQVNKDMEWIVFNTKSQHLASFSQYYRYVESVIYPDTREERTKDVWDVRNLGVPFHTLPSRPRYTINYTSILQPWLKQQIKDFNFYRVQNREMSTVLDDMKAFNLFSKFLSEHHSEIYSLIDITRDTVEDYIAYVRKKGFVASTFNRRLSAIRTFLTLGNMMDMNGFPVKPLFLDTDYAKVVHKMPVPFSDDELRQLNDHIADLPIVYGRIFFVLENCGMRLSDLCCSKILVNGQDCLKNYGKDKYVFTYAMPKVHRNNSIPVTALVAEVIRSAIEDSKNAFGDDCVYIFAKSKYSPIGEEDFVMNMNRLSKRNNIIADDGKILRVKGHTFRRTKASEYANMGVSMDVIRTMLGQKKIGVLKHYITIHSATMIDALKPITDADDALIRNIGHVSESILNEAEEKSMQPLSNGYCAKNAASGLCDHAYACYSCRMYHPSRKFLPQYERQLREARNNIQIAELNGYERLLQINQDLEEQLIKIIDAVGGDSNGR